MRPRPGSANSAARSTPSTCASSTSASSRGVSHPAAVSAITAESSASRTVVTASGVRGMGRSGYARRVDRETIFTLEATPIKFGPGAAADAGWELERLGTKRVLLVTDPGVAAQGHPGRVREAIERAGIEVVVYDRARVEPTLDSFQEAADFALDAEVDGFVSVGGGSSIDTAKVANLITTHPAPVMDYVNAPIGGGRKPAGVLKPHLAIPTTSGT